MKEEKLSSVNNYKSSYGANFCYEPDWNDADTAEALLGVGEVGVGLAAAALATPESMGAAAVPATINTG